MIKNFSSFDYSPAVNQAVSIAKAGLESVRPEVLLEQAVIYNSSLQQLMFASHAYDLDDYDRIFVVGIGSGTGVVASYIKNILSGTIDAKVFVMDPEAQLDPDERIHRVTYHPTASNAAATAQFLNYGPFTEDDLVIAITDASANSIVNVNSHMPPDQQRAVLQGLCDLGASHDEVLTVAVHLAEGRGGDLARALQPAQILNYVIANRLNSASQPVAASPFLPHAGSLYEAKEIVERYDILAHCNLESCVFITRQSPVSQPAVSYVLLASPLTWLEPMKLMAKEFGLAPQVFTSQDLSFRDDQAWRQTHSQSHCLLSLFPVYKPRNELSLYEDFAGTELYLSSGISDETAGQLLDSESVASGKQIIAEFPTLNVGAVGLRLT